MNERMARLLDYEKRLIQDRQQLLELLAESETTDSQLMNYKLECFQKEIAFLNYQVELLKVEARGQGAYSQSSQAKSAAQTVQFRENVPLQEKPTVQSVQQIPSGQTIQQTTYMQQPRIQQPASERQNIPMQELATEKIAAVKTQAQVSQEKLNNYVKKDLENTIGRSLMGIFASVLIFISLILFATLLLPYFNDTAKMITTYVVSFVFLGIGLVKLRKDKKNKFFIALTGCGIGALYISLLLSNMYFKVLGDIPLYILICIWGIGVSLFAKQQSMIFQVIGELGITIAVAFGSILCATDEDVAKYMALLIFYGISTAVFYVVHFKKEFCQNLPHHICNAINILFLLITAISILEDGSQYILLLVLILLCFISTWLHSQEKESISFGVFAAYYLFMAYSALNGLLGESEVFGIVTYLSTLPIIAFTEYKRIPHKEGKYILQFFLMIMAMLGLSYHDGLYNYGSVFLVVLPLLVGGFFRKNLLFKYGSLAMLLIFLADAYDISEWAKFLLAAVSLGIGFFLLWYKKEQYSRVLKYSLHIITVLVIMCMMNDVGREVIELLTGEKRVYDILRVLTYMSFTLFNIGMLKSVFRKNLCTGEEENPALYNIINIIAMAVGLYMISDGYEGIWHILLILTTLGAFMINAKNLLDKRNNLFAGIYVGIKFAILMVVILNSFDTVNYVISIACLLMAIASIVLGFLGEYKSLRVFGLVLSMISTFKLIMIDISYENTLGNAISFFVSGILCFVISLIYNYIDKKWKENTESTQ